MGVLGCVGCVLAIMVISPGAYTRIEEAGVVGGVYWLVGLGVLGLAASIRGATLIGGTNEVVVRGTAGVEV